MTDNATRTALSGVLAGATVEQLREEGFIYADAAEGIERVYRSRGEVIPSDALATIRGHRLAAGVLLAVAEMQERWVYIVPADGTPEQLSASGIPKWQAYAIGQGVELVRGPTLPAALAALLRGGA